MNSIKLICFDMDGTLITHNSWKELNLSFGMTKEQDYELWLAQEEGRLSYSDWNKKIIEFYKKHPHATKEKITEILSAYTYTHGAKEIVEYLKAKGYTIALISGSIDILVEILARDLGITLYKANNTLIFNTDGSLEDLTDGGSDKIAKLRYLEEFIKDLGISLSECACIGDGANDIELFRATGHGITFIGTEIEKDAWKVISSLSDLRKIL